MCKVNATSCCNTEGLKEKFKNYLRFIAASCTELRGEIMAIHQMSRGLSETCKLQKRNLWALNGN
jgi:hypothetical protein